MKVRWVLKNSGNFLSNEHKNSQFLGKNGWEKWGQTWLPPLKKWHYQRSPCRLHWDYYFLVPFITHWMRIPLFLGHPVNCAICRYDMIYTINITSMMVLVSIYLSVSTSLPRSSHYPVNTSFMTLSFPLISALTLSNQLKNGCFSILDTLFWSSSQIS